MAILGGIALSLDGGLLLDNGRQSLAAADAAAWPPPANSFRTGFTNGALDNGPLPGQTGPAAGDIRTFAREIARADGFEDGEKGVTVDVPPISGPFTGQRGHVEVRIRLRAKTVRQYDRRPAQGDSPGRSRWRAAIARPDTTASASSIRTAQPRSVPAVIPCRP